MKKIAYALTMVLMISLVGCGSVTKNTTTPTAVTPSVVDPSYTPRPAPPNRNKPTISKTDFDQLKNGLTRDQVIVIAGFGEKVTEESYKYRGDKTLGWDAQLMFEDGRLLRIVGGIK